jgi:hypothetical protein
MSALVTEHFVLQSASSTTVAESSSRASLYMLSLSSALVALGFTAQTPEVFAPFAATVLPTVFLLGCFTIVRLVDTGVQNVDFLRSITRIRRYYSTLTPHAAAVFAPWTGSDETEQALSMLAVKPSRLTLFFTMASMAAVINGLVGGSCLALLVVAVLGRGAAVLGVGVGAVAAVTFTAAVYFYQLGRYRESADRAAAQAAG